MNLHTINYKQLGVIIPVVIGVVTLALLTNFISTSQTHATIVSQGNPVHLNTSMGPQEDFSKGIIKHYVWQEAPLSPTLVKRGTSVVVPVVIKFWSKTPDESVTLTNFFSDHRDFVPNANASMTDAEFDAKIAEGGPITGEIPVKDYISISPASVNITTNSSATIYVKISIPSNYPDSMLHNDLPIGIGFDTSIPSGEAPITDLNADVVVEP